MSLGRSSKEKCRRLDIWWHLLLFVFFRDPWFPTFWESLLSGWSLAVIKTDWFDIWEYDNFVRWKAYSFWILLFCHSGIETGATYLLEGDRTTRESIAGNLLSYSSLSMTEIPHSVWMDSFVRKSYRNYGAEFFRGFHGCKCISKSLCRHCINCSTGRSPFWPPFHHNRLFIKLVGGLGWLRGFF